VTGLTPGSGGVDTLPGDVVRDLVERHEQELASLDAELESVRRQADAAEARIRTHPALGLLSPDEAAHLIPVTADGPADRPASNGAVRPGPPRTTVVHRASRVRAPSPEPGAPDDGDDPPRSRGTRLVTSHWVWKAGVALTVVALLLVKFG